MSSLIESIVIVGGGTSGWLSAVFLNRALNTASDTHCRITLVESSDIGTIGVGEATIPSIRKTFRFCGIDEMDWMTKCNASFKMAIKFVNWSGRSNPDIFWHPFGLMDSLDGFPISHYWLKRRLLNGIESFDYSCFPTVHACDARKAPKQGGEPPFIGQVDYAYHLDAGLLATYLKQQGKESRVRHIVDNVLDVAVDERGHISCLRTEKHGEVHGDLFIDCSGFAGLLINKTLKEPFISFSDALFCDSAVAIPVPTDDEVCGINPYTTATALSAGWVWNTPLFGRSGNGYVYSQNCITREEAENELRQHLGKRAKSVEARHINMRVGRTRNAWVRNCVSIGLSGGFIEPLESTGIWFVELGLYNLLLGFPDKTFNQGVIRKYNAIMKRHYEEIRDFIILHYCTTNKEDSPFWKENKYHANIPDTLKEELELWDAMLPNHDKLDERRFFGNHSYVSILAGMGRLPKRTLPFLDYKESLQAESIFGTIKERANKLIEALPDHYEYLARLRREDDYASRHAPKVETITVKELTAG